MAGTFTRSSEMNEDILDLLLYLFENYPMAELVDDGELRDDLDEAGFLPEEVDDAFDWLRGTEPGRQQLLAAPDDHGLRLYSDHEGEWLTPECQGYLHALQRHRILSGQTREIVIDRLLALAAEDNDGAAIEVEQLKWVAMMVLSNQGEEAAYARMEALLHAEQNTPVH